MLFGKKADVYNVETAAEKRTFRCETLRETVTCCQKHEFTTTKSLVFHNVTHCCEVLSVEGGGIILNCRHTTRKKGSNM